MHWCTSHPGLPTLEGLIRKIFTGIVAACETILAVYTLSHWHFLGTLLQTLQLHLLRITFGGKLVRVHLDLQALVRRHPRTQHVVIQFALFVFIRLTRVLLLLWGSHNLGSLWLLDLVVYLVLGVIYLAQKWILSLIDYPILERIASEINILIG